MEDESPVTTSNSADETPDEEDEARDDLDEASTEMIAKNLRASGSSIEDELARMMSREVLDMDILRDLDNQTELNRKTRQFGNQQFAFQQQNQFFNPQQFQNQGQVNQRFTSPGFQNRVPAAASGQFGGQFASQPPQQQESFTVPPQQISQFSSQSQQAALFGGQSQQAGQFSSQQQFGSQPQLQSGQITQQLGQALFGQNPLPPVRQQQQFNSNPAAQSFQPFQQAAAPQQQFQPTATDPQFQRAATGSAFQSAPQQFQQASQQQFLSFQSSPLQSFQDLSGSVQQQSTARPVFAGTPTPSLSFQSFPAQDEIPVRVRPVGSPTSQPSKIFTLDGFDFTGPGLDDLLRTGNALGSGADSGEEGAQPQPVAARPANIRPPPNADPRQKGTAQKGQVSGFSTGCVSFA